MMLLEGLLSKSFLHPKTTIAAEGRPHGAVSGIPWELPGIQAYQIFGVQSTVTDENMVKVCKVD